MSFWDEKETKRLFQKLPFHNTFIAKPHIKQPRNVDLLHELPFYNELSINQVSKAFKRYARSYKIEIIDSKGLLPQLKASKSDINDLFKNLLEENKGLNIK